MADTKFLLTGGGAAGTYATPVLDGMTCDFGPGIKYTATWSKFGTSGVVADDSAYTDYSLDSSIAGDFTVEAWFVAEAVQTMPAGTNAELISISGAESILVDAHKFSGFIRLTYTPVPNGAGAETVDLIAIGSVPVHIVVQRTVADGKLAVYANGTRVQFLPYGTAEDRAPAGISFSPRNPDLLSYMPVLDEIRISSVARYTSGGVSPATIAVQSATFGSGAVTNNVALVCPSGQLAAAATGLPPLGTALIAPVGTLSAFSGGAVGLIAPRPALAIMTGAGIALTAPSPLLTSLGHDSTGEQAAYLTAPSPQLAITTGAHAKNLATPSPTLAATGTVTIMASAALRAPKPVLSATGKVSGMVTTTLSAPRPNLIGYGGAVCSVTVRGKASLTATGTTGGVASAAVTCPLFELTATASIGNVASANLVAPSPQLGRTIQAWLTAPSARLTAIGTAVVTATYEAYAVNLGHRPRVTNQELPIDEVTHYTNFPFTHVVRYQNSYYGANTTGLYLLEGTTDDGTAIPWAVKTAMDDFKTPVKKTVAVAYFGGRFGPASTVQLHAGEQTPATYSFSTPRDALAQNHRQVFGKGVKERYFALGASGIGVCEIDSVELETHNMTRRI